MAAVTRRITVVTAGHLSSCPRMLKAADAFHDAGYQVRVVSARHTEWATAADLAVRATRNWAWRVVDYGRASGWRRRLTTAARFRAAGIAARAVGAGRVALPLAIRAYSRAHDELVRTVASEPADLIYGGTTGALAAVAEAASRLGIPYGLDLEDFHSAEQDSADGELANALATRVEMATLKNAAFLTAASPMIADAYRSKYGVEPTPIHNTFSLRFSEDEMSDRPGRLRLYWFSQTLGPGRGIEDAVEAAGRTNLGAELHLRARPIEHYVAELERLRNRVAPTLAIVRHAPAAPDDMVPLAQPYDLGLSCEQTRVPNRRLSLNNKIFTYLAAGLPVVLSATPAQAQLARDLDGAAFVYEPGDVDGLAAHFRRWSADRDRRLCARRAARAAAERRWHWEHPDDRGALLQRICACL